MCNSSYYFWFLKLAKELWNCLAEFTSELVYGICTFSISPNYFYAVGQIIYLLKHTTSMVRKKKGTNITEKTKRQCGYKTTLLHLFTFGTMNKFNAYLRKRYIKDFTELPKLFRGALSWSDSNLIISSHLQRVQWNHCWDPGF